MIELSAQAFPLFAILDSAGIAPGRNAWHGVCYSCKEPVGMQTSSPEVRGFSNGDVKCRPVVELTDVVLTCRGPAVSGVSERNGQ